MELKAVHDYTGAQYPSLADYIARKRRQKLSCVSLASALTMIAVLFDGCRSIS